MRLILTMTMLAALASFGSLTAIPTSSAQAQECTGENCPPTSGQSGGHDCESKKKDQTIS